MPLSSYHQQYSSLLNEEIQRRINEKEEEFKAIFSQCTLKTNSEIIKVAVLGCADRRLITAHKQLFEKYTGKSVHLATFDITIEHLQGEENVFKHDCTMPLPNPPYDIIYGHVLLKFIQTDRQWNVIKNSYNALKQEGMAIHIFDKEEIESAQTHLTNGQFSVPLKQWEEQLHQKNINFREIPIKYGLALIIQKLLNPTTCLRAPHNAFSLTFLRIAVKIYSSSLNRNLFYCIFKLY